MNISRQYINSLVVVPDNLITIIIISIEDKHDNHDD